MSDSGGKCPISGKESSGSACPMKGSSASKVGDSSGCPVSPRNIYKFFTGIDTSVAESPKQYNVMCVYTYCCLLLASAISLYACLFFT